MIFHVLHAVLWAVPVAALLASAWTDLKDRIIPNELVVLVALSGLGLGLLLRPDAIWISLLAAVLVLLVLGLAAHFGMMGGGDVKLISAATLLVPPGYIAQLIVFIALAGGLLSAGYFLARRMVGNRPVGRSLLSAEAAERDRWGPGGWVSNERARIAAGGPMPYALAIVGGVAITLAGELSRCLSANFCSF